MLVKSSQYNFPPQKIHIKLMNILFFYIFGTFAICMASQKLYGMLIEAVKYNRFPPKKYIQNYNTEYSERYEDF